MDASRLRRAWITAGALGLALVASLLAVAIAWRTPKPAARAMFFSVPFQAEVRDLTVGPDGHTVAVVGYSESARKNAIWLYDVGSQASNRLANTEGANFPFWSADGQSLAFFADGKLKTLEVAGGQVQTLCDAPAGRGGTWNKDGVIIFTPSGQLFQGLYRVAASGGAPASFTHAVRQGFQDEAPRANSSTFGGSSGANAARRASPRSVPSAARNINCCNKNGLLSRDR